ncbi:MAG: DNA alkylation repair protein, partial [Alistipes sp.]|nr:DNA alkylation repair protein [Alistipes sp.]
PEVRAIAKRIGTNHRLAMELFDSGVHEAQILASIVADRRLFTPEDMDCWVADFDSWDVCDQCCMNLFRRLPFAYEKVRFYAAAEREFTRRAGFALLATLAVGDKSAPDDVFRDFLPLTEEYSVDPRPSIRKAVNWALRQIGKRNARLHPAALAAAERIAASGTASARWIGRDAVRELRSESVLRRLGID